MFQNYNIMIGVYENEVKPGGAYFRNISSFKNF